jgi:hypothetical protein
MHERIGVPWENGILRARILTATWEKPAAGSTHWYVVSSALDRVDWNAELVRGDLGKAVQELKRESGSHWTALGADGTLTTRKTSTEIAQPQVSLGFDRASARPGRQSEP